MGYLDCLVLKDTVEFLELRESLESLENRGTMAWQDGLEYLVQRVNQAGVFRGLKAHRGPLE